jgi:hypothetical protein
VSSLTLRSGSISAEGSVTVDPTVRLASTPRLVSGLPWPADGPIEVAFSADEDISERVIFPVTASQSNGIEDVVYTCGAIRHGERIILPYAVSDTFSNFATIRIEALLQSLRRQ